jgi:hypothetical protein
MYLYGIITATKIDLRDATESNSCVSSNVWFILTKSVNLILLWNAYIFRSAQQRAEQWAHRWMPTLLWNVRLFRVKISDRLLRKPPKKPWIGDFRLKKIRKDARYLEINNNVRRNHDRRLNPNSNSTPLFVFHKINWLSKYYLLFKCWPPRLPRKKPTDRMQTSDPVFLLLQNPWDFQNTQLLSSASDMTSLLKNKEQQLSVDSCNMW